LRQARGIGVLAPQCHASTLGRPRPAGI
jgi:hypothetical protein